MIFEGKTILNEGSRVIGLNDNDLAKLSIVKEEVKFEKTILENASTPQNVAAPEMVVANPVSGIQSVEDASETVIGDVVNAVKNEETNVFNQIASEEVPLYNSQSVVEEKNIFDMPLGNESIQPGNVNPGVVVPNVEIPAINVENNINSAVSNQPINEPVLETPVQFYQSETVQEAPTVIVEEHKEDTQVDRVSQYLDEIRKAIDSKNEIIKALKDKNELLISENNRMLAQINELKNQIAIANQRTAIAESQRAAQVTGMQQQVSQTNTYSTPQTPFQAA